MNPYSDKRWYDDPGAKTIPCPHCIYYKGYFREEGIQICDAFMSGIPHELKIALANGKTNECIEGFKFEENKNWKPGLLLYKPEE